MLVLFLLHPLHLYDWSCHYIGDTVDGGLLSSADAHGFFSCELLPTVDDDIAEVWVEFHGAIRHRVFSLASIKSKQTLNFLIFA